MDSLDMLANNVANTGTSGFKADREFYNLYREQLPVVETHWTDFSQGTLTPTGNPLNLGLAGAGFFALTAPSGVVYTRNGNFHLSKGQLVTAEGYPVPQAGGQALTLPGSGPLEVSSDGSVLQDGNLIGQLQIVDFPAAALAKQGANYFRVTDPGATPAAVATTGVEQGKLEASNAGGAEGAVRLVGLLRQFEMLQKAVSLGSDMNKQAIEQVAKPGI